jgi:Zn-finger protein
VLILAGCEQLKLCKQCLSVHNPSHKEISIYQLFRDVSNKVKSDQKIEKNKEKFDIVFKHI